MRGGRGMPSAPGPAARCVAALALAIQATACVSSVANLTTDGMVPPRFPTFSGDPAGRPAVSSGRAGWPIMAFDPGIYVDEEGYHLFYTSVFCRSEYGYSYSWDPSDPSACNIVDDLGSVAYAFSRDRGLTWEFRVTPVVMPGHSGFDSAKIETPYVFRIGEMLYLAYSADGERDGEKLASRYQIGVARLEIGHRSVRDAMLDESTRFERRARPLLPYDLRPGRFDNNVQEPSIVLSPNGVVLYYVGLGLTMPEASMDAPGQQITSVGLGRAVLDSELNVVSRSSGPLLEAANIVEVRYFDDAFQLFGVTPGIGEFHEGVRISHSTSQDGIVWTEPTTLLADGVPGLDDWGAMGPTVVAERDHVVLFYTALSSAARACFPVPPDGRFGMPVRDGQECLYATIGRAVSRR